MTRDRRGLRAAGALLAVTLAAAGCTTPPPAPEVPAPGVAVSVPSATASGTPTPSPSATPVAASELRRIAIPELGFDQPSQPVSTAAMGNAIDPPRYRPGRPSTPIRVSDKGVRPSTDAEDTVYLGCHTSSRNGPDKYPCDVLTRQVRSGMKIVATTDAGTLTYTVRQTRSIPYDDFAGDEQTWRVEAGRLVFVMCDILDGTPTHANYVIYASLT